MYRLSRESYNGGNENRCQTDKLGQHLGPTVNPEVNLTFLYDCDHLQLLGDLHLAGFDDSAPVMHTTYQQNC